MNLVFEDARIKAHVWSSATLYIASSLENRTAARTIRTLRKPFPIDLLAESLRAFNGSAQRLFHARAPRSSGR